MSVSFPLCWSKVHSVKNPDHFAEEEGTAGVLIHVCYNNNTTGVNQKVLPVLSTETLLHIWLSTEYYGFRPSSTAVDTGDYRNLMMSK